MFHQYHFIALLCLKNTTPSNMTRGEIRSPKELKEKEGNNRAKVINPRPCTVQQQTRTNLECSKLGTQNCPIPYVKFPSCFVVYEDTCTLYGQPCIGLTSQPFHHIEQGTYICNDETRSSISLWRLLPDVSPQTETKYRVQDYQVLEPNILLGSIVTASSILSCINLS